MSFVRQTVKYVKAKPDRLFWAFALCHMILWTAIPAIVSPNLPLDVIEGYAWGKEWLIGTHKHPPMQAWILEILVVCFGTARWAPYFASQIAIVTAFWAVWKTGRRIAGDQVGLIGALLLEGIVYYNFTSPEFNPNVLQIPFWALAGWSCHKAVKDNKVLDWVLLGLWAAAGLYTKYSSALFLLVLLFALLAHRDGRQRFKSVGPYLSLATATLLFLPHLSWLMHNNFLPLAYAENRLERNPDHYSAALTTTFMVAGQLLALFFAVLLIISLCDRRSSKSIKPAPSFDRIFLSFTAFGPFLAMLCLSSVFGFHIRDMWETPFWNFIGLWAIVFIRPTLTARDLRRFGRTWIVVFFTGLLFFSASEIIGPFVTIKPKRTIFPGKHLSHIIIDTWHAEFNMPLKYVVGDTWPAGNVAFYADDRPHVFMDGDMRFSPWIDQADLKKSGGVIVWCIHCGDRTQSMSLPDPFKSEFPSAITQEPLTLTRMTYADVFPAVIGWAIIPPAP